MVDAGTMTPLTIVPLAAMDYRACWVVPGTWTEAWPGGHKQAVVLELEPEGPDRFKYTSDQTWPADAIRYASTLGYELTISRSGLPIADQLLLRAPDQGWHHLTLAFGEHLAARSLTEWSDTRESLLQNLAPEHWPAPNECDAILHVGDTDYLQFLARSELLLQSWLAYQVALWFSDLAADESTSISRRLINDAVGVGARLQRLDRTPSGLRLVGHYGRGRRTLLRAGKEKGAAFQIDL